MHPGYGEVEQVTSQEVQSIPIVHTLVPSDRRARRGSLRKPVSVVDFWKIDKKCSLCVDLALQDYQELCGGQGSVCSTDLTTGAETDRQTNSGVKWDGGGGLGQMSDRAKCWQPYHQPPAVHFRLEVWEREAFSILHDNFRDGSGAEEGFQGEYDHISRAEGGGKGRDNKIYIKTMSKEEELLNKTKWKMEWLAQTYAEICNSSLSVLNVHQVYDFIPSMWHEIIYNEFIHLWWA